MKKPEHISEKELDQLINQSFLELDETTAANSAMLDAVASSTFSGKALLYSVFGTGFFKLALMLISLGSFTVLMVNVTSSDQIQVLTNKTLPEAPGTNIKASVEPIKSPKNEKPALKNNMALSPDKDKDREPEGYLPEPEQTAQPSVMAPLETILYENHFKTNEDAYVFPVLTEKEIRANEKEKRHIVKTASRLNKDFYYPIKNGSEAARYHMRTTEITNIEYRTFLFDLLINERKEEFLKAKPHQDLWINAAGRANFDHLAKTYFSDKKYNEHPVVNITIQGAEMYCRWLTELVRASDANDNKIAEFRLPDESDWQKAANSVAGSAYPWPKDSIQNQVNFYLANICIQKLKHQLKTPVNYPKRFVLNPKAYTSAGYILNDTTVATVLAYAYNPNDYHLFCMSGNVSEMVYLDGTKNVRTKGGSWNSDFEHAKINSEDEFPLNPPASPYIGFRIAAYLK